jgi:hypothetical protein
MIDNNKITKLEKILKQHIGLLCGDFVSKNSGYDGDICKIIEGFEETTKRYWDCFWEEETLYLEFKKGRSIWLDIVRYSEIILKTSEESSTETFTLFFIPDIKRSKIVEIIGMETSKLIKKINLDEKDALELLHLNKTVPRSFNAQASLTVNDIKAFADFVVKI